MDEINEEIRPGVLIRETPQRSFLCERAIAIFNSHLVKIVVTDHFTGQPIRGAKVELNLIITPPIVKKDMIAVTNVKVPKLISVQTSTDKNGVVFLSLPSNRNDCLVINFDFSQTYILSVTAEGYDIRHLNLGRYGEIDFKVRLNISDLYQDQKAREPMFIPADEVGDVQPVEVHRVSLKKKLDNWRIVSVNVIEEDTYFPVQGASVEIKSIKHNKYIIDRFENNHIVNGRIYKEIYLAGETDSTGYLHFAFSPFLSHSSDQFIGYGGLLSLKVKKEGFFDETREIFGPMPDKVILSYGLIDPEVPFIISPEEASETESAGNHLVRLRRMAKTR
jgi:hypothetical protein